jgi:uncharacterized membrane protein
MDLIHLHLLLNHLPVVGTLFGTVFLIWGLAGKDQTVLRVAYVTFVAISIVTIPVVLTGQVAEEVVEQLPGVSETIIESHETVAEITLWGVLLLGAVSLLALHLARRDRYPSGLASTTAVVLALVVLVLMIRVGYTGGQIRHTELRAVTGQTELQKGEPAPIFNTESDHEDDGD